MWVRRREECDEDADKGQEQSAVAGHEGENSANSSALLSSGNSQAGYQTEYTSDADNWQEQSWDGGHEGGAGW
jgi:hypothetical protein